MWDTKRQNKGKTTKGIEQKSWSTELSVCKCVHMHVFKVCVCVCVCFMCLPEVPKTLVVGNRHHSDESGVIMMYAKAIT